MPNSLQTSVMASPSRSRATKRRRSSITELAFHGIYTSRRTKAESVTHVSGTFWSAPLAWDRKMVTVLLSEEDHLSTHEPRRFSREFKLEALRRMEAGENVSDLARQLGVSRKSIYQWRNRYRLGGSKALRGRGRMTNADRSAVAAGVIRAFLAARMGGCESMGHEQGGRFRPPC